MGAFEASERRIPRARRQQVPNQKRSKILKVQQLRRQAHRQLLVLEKRCSVSSPSQLHRRIHSSLLR